MLTYRTIRVWWPLRNSTTDQTEISVCVTGTDALDVDQMMCAYSTYVRLLLDRDIPRLEAGQGSEDAIRKARVCGADRGSGIRIGRPRTKAYDVHR